MKQTFAIDGNRVRKLRAKRLMSATELVKLTGLSQGRLTEIEAGGARVHASTLKRLAEALGVDASELQELQEEELAGFSANGGQSDGLL